MGFNPITMVYQSVQKIFRKKTKSMIQSHIEDRIMGKSENQESDIQEFSIGVEEHSEELCLHGHFPKNCPYCPPQYSVYPGLKSEAVRHGWLVVIEGVQKGRYFPIFEQFENKIGTTKECDIVLIGTNIAPFHSTIYFNPQVKKFMLKDLSPEPLHLTKINGETVPYEGEGIPLVDHMKIQFGDQVICRFKCILD